MSDITTISLPEVTPTAQGLRRMVRLTSRRQRLGLGSACDHKAEIFKAIEAVKLAREITDRAPLPIREADKSAQRQRRANRMATRRQRLKLGPVSEHQTEIARALQLVGNRRSAETDKSAQTCHITTDNCKAEPSGTNGRLADSGISSCDMKISANDDDVSNQHVIPVYQVITFPPKSKRLPFWKRLLNKIQRGR